MVVLRGSTLQFHDKSRMYSQAEIKVQALTTHANVTHLDVLSINVFDLWAGGIGMEWQA